MTRPSIAGRLSARVRAAVVSWGAAACCCACASVLWAAPDDQETTELPGAPNAQQFNQFGMNNENFDQNFESWVFQSRNRQGARELLATKVRLKLAELEKSCQLTEAQHQRLSLAAFGDQRKFFDEYEIVRQKFRSKMNDQQAWQQMWQEIQPLQQKYQAGLFGDRSLFERTLMRMLDPDQQKAQQAQTDQRRRFRYQAAIDATFIRLERKVPLKHEQREGLRTLLLAQTKPPRRFGHEDMNFVFFQISRLPAEELQSLLGEPERKLLTQEVAGYARMRDHFIKNGFILAEDVPAAPAERGRRDRVQPSIRRDRRPQSKPAAAEPAEDAAPAKGE